MLLSRRTQAVAGCYTTQKEINLTCNYEIGMIPSTTTDDRRPQIKMKPKYLNLTAILSIAAILTPVNAGSASSPSLSQVFDERKVLVEIAGENFDIPIKYFYEHYEWTRGKWPTPKTERVHKDMVRIAAYIPGMKQWSPELAEEFSQMGEKLNIAWITIDGNSTENWLENAMRLRSGTQREASNEESLHNLQAFKSDSNKDETYYLKIKSEEKSPFAIFCTTAARRYCRVKFTHKNNIIVHYMLPKKHLKKWEEVHHDTVKLINSFIEKKG